jgi:hypothetical protein
VRGKGGRLVLQRGVEGNSNLGLGWFLFCLVDGFRSEL